MITLKPLPFEEALRFFRDKGIALSPLSWRDVWADEHVRAFTVARVAALDVLEDIRAEVERAIRNGIPLKEFKDSIADTLARKGWLAPPGELPEQELPDGTVRKRLTPWRLDTIFRTNLQSAYNTGRYRQMIENAWRRPYWLYDAVNDARTRPAHAAMDNRVYRFDHPIWDTWYPPNGFNCRCTVRALSTHDMERRGLRESITPPDARPDEGFEYNPGFHKWQPDLSRYSPEGRDILRTILAGPTPQPLDVQTLDDVLRIIREKVSPLLPHPFTHVEWNDDNYFMATNGDRSSPGDLWLSKKQFDLREIGGPESYSAADSLFSAFRKLGRRPLTFEEEYAVEVLWHECLHNMQREAVNFLDFYFGEKARRMTMETVTQWTARRTYTQLLDALGGHRPLWQEEIAQRGYGYSYMVGNLDALWARIGADSRTVLPTLTEVIEHVPRDQYPEAIVEKLLERGIVRRLQKPDVYRALISLHEDPDDFAVTLRRIRMR